MGMDPATAVQCKAWLASQLEKTKVPCPVCISNPGDTQERGRAGLGSNNRTQQGPPGNIPSTQQIGIQVLFAAAYPEAEQDHQQQVTDQDQQIPATN